MREKDFMNTCGDVLIVCIIVYIIAMMLLITTAFVIGLLAIIGVV